MANTLFFRVERNNQGPYTGHNYGEEGLESMSGAHGFERSHPNPYCDKGLENEFQSGHHVCGFATTHKMVRWFESWGPVLEDAGYEICVYRVPGSEVLNGEFQDIVSLDVLDTPVHTLSPRFM